MKIVIPIQSFSDLITNSSSEVFVISNNDNSIEDTIRTILYKLCEATEQNLNDILTIHTSKYSYRDPDYEFLIKEGDILIESYNDNSIPSWIMDFIEYYLEGINSLEGKIKCVKRHHLG